MPPHSERVTECAAAAVVDRPYGVQVLALVLCAGEFHAGEIDSEQRFSVLNSRCPSPACQSFGAFMLYWWKRGDETQAHPVPGYIYLVLALGCAASIESFISSMSPSRRAMSC